MNYIAKELGSVMILNITQKDGELSDTTHRMANLLTKDAVVVKANNFIKQEFVLLILYIKGGENMNKDSKNKEVEEKAEIVCGRARECCGIHLQCEATYHLLPTGKLVWKNCFCNT